MLTMYGIKNCDTIKKPAAGWKRIRLSIASMITAPMALSVRNWIPLLPSWAGRRC